MNGGGRGVISSVGRGVRYVHCVLEDYITHFIVVTVNGTGSRAIRNGTISVYIHAREAPASYPTDSRVINLCVGVTPVHFTTLISTFATPLLRLAI
jgi:hypothetical protein